MLLVTPRSARFYPVSHHVLAADIGAWHRAHGAEPPIASSHAILRTRGSAVDAEIPLPPPGQVMDKGATLSLVFEPAS